MAEYSNIIPEGFCQCGCGQRTRLARQTDNAKGYIKNKPMKYIYGHYKNGFGESASNWKGGRMISKEGYPEIYNLNHHRTHNKCYVYEHILKAEKALGKPLPPKVQVHHHTTEDLVICENHAYHRLFHQRTRAIRACGHANWRKCVFCKQYDNPVNMILKPNYAWHRACRNDWQNKRYAIKKKR